MRIITCQNADGEMLRFGMDYTPWLLTDADGLYLSDGNVYTSENTMIDGSTYQNTIMKARNIVLTMVDRNMNHKYNRQVLYDVFKPKTAGTLSYTEGGETRTATYYVESIESTTMGGQRTATVSLICTDPYFYAERDTVEVIAGWTGLWVFPHEFKDGGEEFGVKSVEKLKTIVNSTAADNIGMTITIVASGDVLNPSVTCVETQEMIKVGTEAHPLWLKSGDELTITTSTGNKHVYLTTGGVTTEINEYLDEDSDFIQLMRGDNTIGYDADEGSDYMSVSVAFRWKYLGV